MIFIHFYYNHLVCFTASDEAAAKSKAIPTPTLKRGASKTTQGKFQN